MLESIIRRLDAFLSGLGQLTALAVLGMAALISVELFSRGVLQISQPWVQDVSSWLLTIFIYLGGPYALLRGNFVRVDVIFGRFSMRTQALVDSIFSTTLVALFLGVLLWRGSEFFLNSFAMGERSATGAWGGPVWLAKSMVPLGAGLLLLAWLVHVLRAWQRVLSPQAPPQDSGSTNLEPES